MKEEIIIIILNKLKLSLYVKKHYLLKSKFTLP